MFSEGENMATSLDVAQYILERRGATTTIKLQKLVYYSQAWSLVWDEEPLFDDRIEAWANGPVAPKLFQAHKGSYKVSRIPEGNSANLNREQKATIDKVVEFYAQKPAHWLIELTHMEQPWIAARGACPSGVACQNEISHAAMAEYYSSL